MRRYSFAAAIFAVFFPFHASVLHAQPTALPVDMSGYNCDDGGAGRTSRSSVVFWTTRAVADMRVNDIRCLRDAENGGYVDVYLKEIATIRLRECRFYKTQFWWDGLDQKVERFDSVKCNIRSKDNPGWVGYIPD